MEKISSQSPPPAVSSETMSQMSPKKDGSLPTNIPLKRTSKVSNVSTNVKLEDISNQSDVSKANENQKPVVNIHKEQTFNFFDNMRFAPHMSIPGLKNVLESKFPKFLRAIWILAMTFCVVFTFYQISIRLKDYLSNPVVLDTRIFREPFVKLPNITFCPIDLDDNYYDESVDYTHVTIEELLAKAIIPEDKFKIEFSCSESSNSKKKKKGKAKRNCTVRVKKISVKTVWGTCVTIAFQDPMDYEGIRTYVQITIEENVKKSISNINETKIHNDKTVIIYENAYLYFYHTDEEFSFDKPCLDFRWLLKGRLTENQLKLKEFHIRNGRCSDSLSVTKCLNTCLNKEVIGEVNCSLPFLLTSELPECTLENDYETYESILQIYSMTNLSSCDCPRRCVEYLYSVSETLHGTFTDGNTILKLTFEHNNREEVIERSSYTFSMLLGDIGGNLGLFLGWCVLSLLEVLQSFCYHLKSSFDKCRENTI